MTNVSEARIVEWCMAMSSQEHITFVCFGFERKKIATHKIIIFGRYEMERNKEKNAALYVGAKMKYSNQLAGTDTLYN